MVFVYILRLKFNKYYIGKTFYPKSRLGQHFKSMGSGWTKKYPPLEIVSVIPNCDSYDEDKWTLKFMDRFGISNVRGGSFCRVKMHFRTKRLIRMMINGSSDRCFNCGSHDHFANKCNNAKTKNRSKERKKFKRYCKKRVKVTKIKDPEM